ncbi:molecular chaperone [Erythrobacter arachoides]|uniref:Molecular chaperone n=1 Tax=Aurantiacibacter arachoides TaxID=1850444 RepID=A0A844ZZP4_9SPHN|nr:ATP12 family chaperone protein [Aurantiacibacter arachoides]MXO92396.1 molecular chaperone [Aurantiacibacter arachoides]GGD57494.1 ATPase [Aurantiacibacter arachoides]
MKRFYADVAVEEGAGGWRVTLDGRPIRTQKGAAQVVPSRALADLLAGEWRAQGDTIDPRGFIFRDMADLAIDVIRPDRAATVAKLLSYADTDTLCYRAEPDEPLWHRQQALWEPLLAACEARHSVTFERTSGIVHKPHDPATMAALGARLEGEDDFTLAALLTLASLAGSLVVALAALEPGADAPALYAAANAEEDWQAELWGWEQEAEKVRVLRLEAFEKAAQFAAAITRLEAGA